MYKIIKKFLNDGGKCLLIEDSKPVGVVLTVEEYELLRSKTSSSTSASAEATADKEKSLFSEVNDKPAETVASAEIADIEAVDDITLEDLGIDELPY